LKAGPARRDPTAGGLALAWCCAALIALPLAFANQWLWFGIVAWLMLLLGVAIGYGPQFRRKTILVTLSAVFLLYTACLLGISWTYRPDAGLVLFGGLPLPTAFFIYGIWPLGAALGLLYGLEFRRSILPQHKLDQFLAEFGRKE
jgi:hypothetical protein